MKKRLISLMVAVVMLFSMLCPAAYADDETKSFDACSHDWVIPIRSGYSVSVPGTDYSISVKTEQCSKCKWYKHIATLIFAEFTYYSPLNVDVNGLIPTELTTYWLNVWYNTFGKNATATKFTPGGGSTSGGGVGRPKGYSDDNGTPIYNVSGKLQLVIEPYGIGTMNGDNISSGLQSNDYIIGSSGSGTKYIGHSPSIYGAADTRYTNPVYYFTAPESGVYYIGSAGSPYNFGNIDLFYDNSWHSNSLVRNYSDEYKFSRSMNKGDTCTLTISFKNTHADGCPYRYSLNPIVVFVDPLSDSSVSYNTKITINNNTWNGNIYTDNSTNLTYIYPQYTTVNEKNETVTNISTNPIIYNNEEHKYYTYDTVTNNFYYINYGTSDPSATPTPKPTFKPGGGSSRGGGVGRHHGDDGTSDEDWYKSYYILNDYDYDCYYGNFYVDDGQGNTYGKSKTRVSTTAIPIADGTYKVTVPDDVNWRAWRWDADAKVAVPVNSDTWKSSMYYDFYSSEDIIFEFRKIDGSQIKPKEIILRLDNPTIVEYEPGGKKHEYKPDPIYPDEQSYIIPKMNSNNFTDSHGTWIASGSTKYSSSYDYFMAFDRSSSTGWCMGDGSGGKGGRELPCYVQITIPDPQNYYINGYVMRGYKAEEYPSAWILQASTDGTDWEDLDTQTAQDLSDFKEHSYSLGVHKAYKYYRMKVTAYPNNYMGIGCFNLLGYNAEDVIIPSPTPAPTDPPSPSPAPDPGKPDSGDKTKKFWTIIFPNGGGSEDGKKGIFWALVSLILALIAFFANLAVGVGYLFPFLPDGVVMTINTCLIVIFLFTIIKFIMRSK